MGGPYVILSLSHPFSSLSLPYLSLSLPLRPSAESKDCSGRRECGRWSGDGGSWAGMCNRALVRQRIVFRPCLVQG